MSESKRGGLSKSYALGYPWRPLCAAFKTCIPHSLPRPIIVFISSFPLLGFWVHPLPTPTSLSQSNAPSFFLPIPIQGVSESSLWLPQRPNPVEKPRKVFVFVFVYFAYLFLFHKLKKQLVSGAVVGMIKLALEAGKATPAPPVGPALGSKGVNIMAFCKDYNARTADKAGYVIPVEITVYDVSHSDSSSSSLLSSSFLYYTLHSVFVFSG